MRVYSQRYLEQPLFKLGQEKQSSEVVCWEEYFSSCSGQSRLMSNSFLLSDIAMFAPCHDPHHLLSFCPKGVLSYEKNKYFLPKFLGLPAYSAMNRSVFKKTGRYANLRRFFMSQFIFSSYLFPQVCTYGL